MAVRQGAVAARAAVVAVLVVLVAAVPALAQDGPAPESLDVTVDGVDFGDDDQTRIVVDVSGVDPAEVDASMFEVEESGGAITDFTLDVASDVDDAPPRSVLLAMDTSDSTLGAPRRRSIAAAKEFANTVLERGVSVGVLAFHRQTDLLLRPTDDPAEVEAALDDMPGGFGTVLNDAVQVGAATLARENGERRLVLFSDGADAGSTATLADAVSTAKRESVQVDAVALSTDSLDVPALESLATQTEGRLIEVQDVGGLSGAFAELAADLVSQYVITYPTTDLVEQYGIEVAVSRDDVRHADTIQVFKSPDVVGADPTVRRVAPPRLFASQAVATGAVVVAGVGLALLLIALFVPVGDRQVARNLQGAIGGDDESSAPREDLSPTTAAMSRRAIQLVERVPKPEGYDGQVQARIDQAAWPLRASEFTTLRAIAALVGLGLGWSIVNVVIGALMAAVGWVIPNIVLGIRVSRRQKRFMDQLPDTLQLLAGSMKAGYGVLQSIDTVVKETPEPTRSEFQRVLSEARLGLPLDDSLMEMAERVGTEDFRWVAVSISIQRRVGGNLAQLLETVAATLRERASTRRQISALSAEGRLSAGVLLVLPFALGLYIFLSNPQYLAPLATTGAGQAMLVGSAVLMGVGIYWMKNLIEIDV